MNAPALRNATKHNIFNAQPLVVFYLSSSSLIGLVDDQKDRFTTFESQFGHPAILFRNNCTCLYNHPNDIRAIGSLNNLLLDGEFKLILSVFHTSGINQPELVVTIAGFGNDTIAGGAWLVSYNGFATMQNHVE